MSKPVKRKCPQCGQVKPFRADQKTCGCPHPGVPPKVDRLLVGTSVLPQMGMENASWAASSRASVRQYTSSALTSCLKEKNFGARRLFRFRRCAIGKSRMKTIFAVGLSFAKCGRKNETQQSGGTEA